MITTTLELNPVTERILAHAINVIMKHRASSDEDMVRQYVLEIIREEEIKMHRLLLQFCELPVDERKAIWTRIFTRLTCMIEDKKVQKKVFKECKETMESILADACGAPERQLVAKSSY